MMSVLSKDQIMSKGFSEIGSEFWIETEPGIILSERDGVYCISGRTAIDLILQDLCKKRMIRSVYMPAWCCDSMLAPFLNRDIEVEFYDVVFDGRIEYLIDETVDADVFYLTNYFGYENNPLLDIVIKMKERGAIVLYDRTHSFLMDDSDYQELSDYYFTSIRKWMGVISGALVKGIEQPPLKHCPYISIKEFAMHNKFHYLQGDDSISKDRFLNAFRDFGHRLTDDYHDYGMDDLSYTLYKQEDLQKMAFRRRKNASYIHENLYGLQFIGALTENSCPLFVPVLFENKMQRDEVRKELIEQQIYCPIHWPKPSQIPEFYKVNDIVDRELSLICDQRYGLNEMKQQVDTIQQLI